MNFVNVSKLLFQIIILVYCTPSLSIVYIHSDDLGHRLCRKFPVNLRNCEAATSQALRHITMPQRYPSITSPRIAIRSNTGLSFNMLFKNATRIPKVRTFAMMGEGAEVDISLVGTVNEYKIDCFSYGNASKVFSNIVMSPDTKHFIGHENQDYPNVYKLTIFNNVGKILQSGHFTCASMADENSSESLNIFTQSSKDIGTSPFVKYGEPTIQSDEGENGFVVPCRTNYRMESPPELLWKKREEDNFTMLSTEEMKSFKWDALVGFKFSSSIRKWEMKILACRFGSFETTYLPTPSRFMKSVFVTALEDQISCSFGTRNSSSGLLLASKLAYDQARYYSCLTFIGCDLLMQVGLLFLNKPNRAFSTDKFGMQMLSDDRTHGILSCLSEHFYDGERVPESKSKIFFQGLDSNVYLLPGSYPNSSVIHIDSVDGPFYKNHTELYHSFSCKAVNFILFGEMYFIVRYEDLTETVVQGPEDDTRGMSAEAEFEMQLHTNMTHAICLMLTMDGKVVSAEAPLRIVDVFAPVYDIETADSRIFKIGDLSNFTLTCPITGEPPPQYQWTFDEKNTGFVEGTNARNLSFREFRVNLTGNYSCHASNEYGSNSFQFQVKVEPEDVYPGTMSILGIVLSTFSCFILLCATVLCALKYFIVQRQVRDLTPKETMEFLSGIPVSQVISHNDGYQMALQLPFTKFIAPNTLVVVRETLLGRGQFGIVYRGILNGQAVAVKTFKPSLTSNEFRAGLSEVKLMNFVGEHLNIVKFIGADVTNIERRDILIVMELSLFGSLEKHLRMMCPSKQVAYANTTAQYANVYNRSEYVRLFGYCEQIAFAMEYLESKRVIHGDLATRNVLVFSHGTVKVTDFGYSRQLPENNIYKSHRKRLLPWRSASIELLRHMEFSTDSDIWAFGVTVWEIFTFGNVPFAGERWNERFMRSLENGLRLKKLTGFSETQFSFVKECWAVEKSLRPRFSALKNFFALEKANLQRDLGYVE